ncbi:MAG TPA: formate/nitrite transporter family protein [Candidatus Angelobacter sp.]|nr:formate/nitrite transporter family protein [Candidatus Angelobacter sp.]
MSEKSEKVAWEAEQRKSPSGAVVYKAILQEGFDELSRPPSALFWSGLAAGLSMGASLIAEGLLSSHLPEAPWRPLVSKFGYSVGFLVVILGRQQLFTENTLTPILPLLKEKTWHRFGRVMRLWGIVLFSNLLGCIAAAWVSDLKVAFEPDVRAQFAEIGREAMRGSFGVHVMHGVFAGWLIALMVWLLPFAENARLWVIIILSYFVGLGHFSHVVAGAVQTFYAAFAGENTWVEVFGRYLAPTFIGNVIGGVALVAALNHAQVVSGSKGENI